MFRWLFTVGTMHTHCSELVNWTNIYIKVGITNCIGEKCWHILRLPEMLLDFFVEVPILILRRIPLKNSVEHFETLVATTSKISSLHRKYPVFLCGISANFKIDQHCSPMQLILSIFSISLLISVRRANSFSMSASLSWNIFFMYVFMCGENKFYGL